MAGGASDTVAIIGFGASTTTTLSGGSIDESSIPAYSFVVPRSGTITDMSAFFSTTTGQNFIGTTVFITAQLYQASGNTNTFTPVTGGMVTLSPLSGVLPSGVTVFGTTSGLSIPVTAGTRLMLVFSANATGITLVNTIPGHATGGVNIQ